MGRISDVQTTYSVDLSDNSIVELSRSGTKRMSAEDIFRVAMNTKCSNMGHRIWRGQEVLCPQNWEEAQAWILGDHEYYVGDYFRSKISGLEDTLKYTILDIDNGYLYPYTNFNWEKRSSYNPNRSDDLHNAEILTTLGSEPHSLMLGAAFPARSISLDITKTTDDSTGTLGYWLSSVSDIILRDTALNLGTTNGFLLLTSWQVVPGTYDTSEKITQSDDIRYGPSNLFGMNNLKLTDALSRAYLNQHDLLIGDTPLPGFDRWYENVSRECVGKFYIPIANAWYSSSNPKHRICMYHNGTIKNDDGGSTAATESDGTYFGFIFKVTWYPDSDIAHGKIRCQNKMRDVVQWGQLYFTYNHELSLNSTEIQTMGTTTIKRQKTTTGEWANRVTISSGQMSLNYSSNLNVVNTYENYKAEIPVGDQTYVTEWKVKCINESMY